MLGKTLGKSKNTPKTIFSENLHQNLSEMFRQIFGEVENCQKTVKTYFKCLENANFQKIVGKFSLLHIINYLSTEFAFCTVRY